MEKSPPTCIKHLQARCSCEHFIDLNLPGLHKTPGRGTDETPEVEKDKEHIQACTTSKSGGGRGATVLTTGPCLPAKTGIPHEPLINHRKQKLIEQQERALLTNWDHRESSCKHIVKTPASLSWQNIQEHSEQQLLPSWGKAFSCREKVGRRE